MYILGLGMHGNVVGTGESGKVSVVGLAQRSTALATDAQDGGDFEVELWRACQLLEAISVMIIELTFCKKSTINSDISRSCHHLGDVVGFSNLTSASQRRTIFARPEIEVIMQHESQMRLY